jgi:NTP pyrophosphatase (non-canonical NTP hydrolase)
MGDPMGETNASPAQDQPATGRPAERLPISLREAQTLVDDWMRAQQWAYWQPLSQLARMAEELGEVARVVNHLYGEKPKKPDEPAQDLGMELADLLYTMICLANAEGIDLQDSLQRVLEKYRVRDVGRFPAPIDRGED